MPEAVPTSPELLLPTKLTTLLLAVLPPGPVANPAKALLAVPTAMATLLQPRRQGRAFSKIRGDDFEHPRHDVRRRPNLVNPSPQLEPSGII